MEQNVVKKRVRRRPMIEVVLAHDDLFPQSVHEGGVPKNHSESSEVEDR